MATLKEKLAALDRKRVEITIQSKDESSEIVAFYQRPTEADDTVLRKQLQDNFDAIMRGFRTAPDAVTKPLSEQIEETLAQAGPEACINAILVPEFDSIRAEAFKIAGTAPKDNAEQADKDEYQELFKEAFDKELDARRKRFEGKTIEELAPRATEVRLADLANTRAFEVYRRQLVASSIYEAVEGPDGQKTGDFKKAFNDEADVAENLAADTINTVASRCIQELNKARELPLK